jgi:hypothetical protein
MTLNDKDIKLLLQQIKDEKDSKKKAFYKKQLKLLLSNIKPNLSIRSPLGRHKEINTGIKELVDTLTNPLIKQTASQTEAYLDLLEDRDLNINELQRQRDQAKRAGNNNQVAQIDGMLENEVAGRDAIEEAQKAGVPIDRVPELLIKLSSIKQGDLGSLKSFLKQEADPMLRSKAMINYKPELRGKNKKETERRKKELDDIMKSINQNVAAAAAEPEEEQKQQDHQGVPIQAAQNAAAAAQGNNDDDANNDYWVWDLMGQGKRKRKRNVKGGAAGFEDWLSVLGNIPGGSAALSMIPGIGPMLAPVFDLAQTGSRIGSELGKQIKGSPEKMSADTLTGLKGSFGFGRKRKSKGGLSMMEEPYAEQYEGCGTVNNISNFEGAGLSDLLGQLGNLTPQLSGAIGKIPTYGTLAALGNSQVGSASRVFSDIFGKLGLGKKKAMKGGNKFTDFFKNHGKKIALGTLGALGALAAANKIHDVYQGNKAINGIFDSFKAKGEGKRKIKRGAGVVNRISEVKGGGDLLHKSWMQEQRDNQNIVNNRLEKAKQEMQAVKQYNYQLAQKQNVDTQNAVQQLQYAKLLHDVGQLKEEERKKKRAATKRKN